MGVFVFISGLIIGMILIGIIVWLLMPRMMLVVHESRYNNVEETCEKLKSAIEANSWRCPAIRNMNAAMGEQGVELERQVRIVELCKAQYAKDLLTTNPEVSTLLPCAWGVYEKEGKVFISRMNMGLMGKVFGGNIAKVIGTLASKDEEQMLKNIIQK